MDDNINYDELVNISIKNRLSNIREKLKNDISDEIYVETINNDYLYLVNYFIKNNLFFTTLKFFNFFCEISINIFYALKKNDLMYKSFCFLCKYLHEFLVIIFTIMFSILKKIININNVLFSVKQIYFLAIKLFNFIDSKIKI